MNAFFMKTFSVVLWDPRQTMERSLCWPLHGGRRRALSSLAGVETGRCIATISCRCTSDLEINESTMCSLGTLQMGDLVAEIPKSCKPRPLHAVNPWIRNLPHPTPFGIKRIEDTSWTDQNEEHFMNHLGELWTIYQSERGNNTSTM